MKSSCPELLPTSLSRDTIDTLANAALPTQIKVALESPRSVELSLSSELVTVFSEANYLLAWRARKAETKEQDDRPQRPFVSLAPQEIDFIRNLSNGKLAYLVSFVTRQGLEALIELGEKEQSLTLLRDFSRFEFAESPEFIRETLARLHHENWLNQNAILERVHKWNHEWGEYPDELTHGYELDRVQADMDCRALAGLPDENRAHLLSLATPGDGTSFFHQRDFLSVRSPTPVQHDREGQQFSRNRDREELIELVSTVMDSPGGERFYEIHSILDRLETSTRDRTIVENLLYRRGGRIRQDELPAIVGKLSRLPDSVSQLDGQSVLSQVLSAHTDTSGTLQRGALKGLRIEHPERLSLIRRFNETQSKLLLSHDLDHLTPVFRYVDELGSKIQTDEFRSLAAQLREIAHLRRSLISHLSIGLMASEDFEAIIAELNDTMRLSQPFPQRTSLDIYRALPEPSAELVTNDIQRYTRSKDLLIELFSSRDIDPARSPSELITLDSFSRDFPMLREVIDKHLLTEESRDVTKFGGILVDKFSFNSLTAHLASGNWILAKRRAFDKNSGFDGVFIYNTSRNYPQALAPIVRAISSDDNVSFAELFVTDPQRTPGTYQQLLAGMAARLALADIRYSMGTMLEQNARHEKLLTRNDHYKLLGASVYRDDLLARYIPMLWELP